MNIEELFSNIANIGFPIAISCYLLVKLDNELKSLILSINELSKLIEDIKSR